MLPFVFQSGISFCKALFFIFLLHCSVWHMILCQSIPLYLAISRTAGRAGFKYFTQLGNEVGKWRWPRQDPITCRPSLWVYSPFHNSIAWLRIQNLSSSAWGDCLFCASKKEWHFHRTRGEPLLSICFHTRRFAVKIVESCMNWDFHVLAPFFSKILKYLSSGRHLPCKVNTFIVCYTFFGGRYSKFIEGLHWNWLQESGYCVNSRSPNE